MDNNVTFKINIGGNVFTVIGELQGSFEQVVNVIDKVDNSVNHTFTKLKNEFDAITAFKVIDQIKHVCSAMADISKPGIGLEQEMADFSAISGFAGEQLDDLGRTARQVGKESGLGAAQAAKAFSLLASQIDVDAIGLDGLKELQRNAVILSQAAGMSMDESANALAGTINQYGFAASEASRVINVLAAGSKFGAAEIDDLTRSFKVVGAQSSIAGVSLEETAGALEILAKNGLKGAEAGTDLGNIILSLQTVLGADLKNMTLSEALEQLKPQLNDAAFMSQSFGRASMASAQYLVKYSDQIKEMTANVTDTNTAQEQAAIRTETTQQMMERCRAKIDDLKIGFFQLTGSAGGYMTVIAENTVLISQLVPLLAILGKGIAFVTNAQKLQALWTGIVSGATLVWSGVQAIFNGTLWACPITWIVAGIVALIAIIVICVTQVEGWGKQWDSIVNFMQLSGEYFVESIKYKFNSMVSSIMNGLDHIRLGWYQFKEAVGIGDSSENLSMISGIEESINARKQAIVDGEKRLSDLKEQTKGALSWELSWKKGTDEGAEKSILDRLTGGVGAESSATNQNPQKLDLSGKKGRDGSGSKKGSRLLDLNNIVPDLKGSSAYWAIASKLNPVRIASVAGASIALPLTVAATALPATSDELYKNRTEYLSEPKAAGVTMNKFCDTLQIHIANADGKGYSQIEKEVTQVLRKMIDNHDA